MFKTTILAPSTEISDIALGLFHNGQTFVNKYGDTIPPSFAVFPFWTHCNRREGEHTANVKTAAFCYKWGVSKEDAGLSYHRIFN